MAYKKTFSDKRKSAVRTGHVRMCTCLGDLIRASAIQFPNNSRMFLVVNTQYETDYKLYEDDCGKVELVGFVKQLPKGKVKISRSMWGLMFEFIISFKEIKLIGSKEPHHYV